MPYRQRRRELGLINMICSVWERRKRQRYAGHWSVSAGHLFLLTIIQRNFRFLTIWGFTMVLMATWEAQFTASSFALLNGGTAGAIYVYIGAFAGFFLAICSMAEIASMAPTTGGQYRECSSKLDMLMLLIFRVS
jgi:hypothetical protein